jgi:predicted AAA+ superfamily ATPase
LSERELASDLSSRSFLDELFDEGPTSFRAPAEPCNLRHYVERALRGGFPEVATQPSKNLRGRWLAAYIDQLVARDATLHDERRDPVRLRRYLTAMANNTAGVVSDKTLNDAAGINRVTGVAYESLLELLFVTERLPAWHSNRLTRLTRRPKRYLVDPALLGPLVGVDERAALRNADLLGRIVDSFVVSQLRPELGISSLQPRLHHLRLDDGSREVDLIAEAPDGRIVAIEIKSTAAPEPRDAKHLEWLRHLMGDQFVCGVVLHTGPRPFSLGPRIHALPICSIWDRGP